MSGSPCAICGCANSEDDHRCQQCGRLLPNDAVAAPASYISALTRANDRLASVSELAAKSTRREESQFSGYVAHPVRRLAAAAIDGAMVLLGFGVFGGTAWTAGSAFGDGAGLWITAGAALFFLSLFYGLIRVLAMHETPGMRWTKMRLVAIDGSRVDRHRRAVRFVAAWLSCFSGGLGLFWALADDEGLALHDILSGTYPAERENSRDAVSIG